MLRFDVELYHIVSNVTHRVRCYIHLFVASELVSDVEGFIPTRTHTASTNKRLIRLRRISAFLPPESWGISSGGSL
jgi:hypothetical protein